jgi:hypothetical protein
VSYLIGSPGSAVRSKDSGLGQARTLFESYHCFPSGRIVRSPCRREIPRVLVRLGELCGLIYRSDRGQSGRPRSFIHRFEQPPQLACDSTGRQLNILGGSYQVTRRGIEG